MSSNRHAKSNAKLPSINLDDLLNLSAAPTTTNKTTHATTTTPTPAPMPRQQDWDPFGFDAASATANNNSMSSASFGSDTSMFSDPFGLWKTLQLLL